MHSCLVTDKVDFPQEDNVPPSIVSAATARAMGTALDQIIRRDLDPASPNEELVIPVEVRDPNVEQDLDYIWLLDFAPGFPVNPLNDEGDRTLFGAENGPEVRELELTVPLRELGQPGSCHKIELLVSGQFASVVDPRLPEQEGDIAQAVWWVQLTSEDERNVDMGECP